MADSKKAGKGGGAKKYGQNSRKCTAYRARSNAGNTPKARRVLREMLRQGKKNLGNWILTTSSPPKVKATRTDCKKRYNRSN